MPFAPEIPEEVTIDEVRTLLEEAADYLINVQGNGDKESATYQSDVRSATDFIYNWDAIHTAFEASRQPTSSQRMAITGNGNGPEAATGNTGGLWVPNERRSIGSQVVEAEPYTAWVRKNSSDPDIRSFPAIEIEGSSFHSTEQRALLDSTADNMWIPKGAPQLPRRQERRMFLRDILSVVQTTLASVPYIQELNAVTNETGATTVLEGGAKQEVTMAFTTMDAPIRKIAAWIPATNEIFADAPLLRGYVDTRLNYMLAIREEDQVLNGNGTAPNIRGILQTVGLQTQAATGVGGTFQDVPVQIGTAIGKIENVDGDPDGVVMNPLDFWKAVTTRYTSQFDNAYAGPNGAPNTYLSLTWGLPVIRTRAMTAGRALVGSFRLGATLLDRQRITIRSSDSHENYFTLNKVVILAEERVGLAVHRPDFFVDVDLLA